MGSSLIEDTLDVTRNEWRPIYRNSWSERDYSDALVEQLSSELSGDVVTSTDRRVGTTISDGLEEVCVLVRVDVDTRDDLHALKSDVRELLRKDETERPRWVVVVVLGDMRTEFRQQLDALELRSRRNVRVGRRVLESSRRLRVLHLDFIGFDEAEIDDQRPGLLETFGRALRRTFA